MIKKFILLLTFFFWQMSSALAQTSVVELSDGPVHILISRTATEYKAILTPSGGVDSLQRDLTANVFGIEQPPRLVIDIPGVPSRTARTVNLDDPLLAAMRIGVHSDKTRIVLDLRSGKVPSYSIESDERLGALVVNFARGQVAETEAVTARADEVLDQPKQLKPEVVSRPSGEELKDSETVQTIDPVDIPPVEPAVSIEPKVPTEPKVQVPSATKDSTFVLRENERLQELPETDEENPSNRPIKAPDTPDPGITAKSSSASSSIVKGIFYQASKNQDVSALLLDVENLATYSLSQRDANLYELSLDNANLAGDHLSLPQFPPDTFRGFEVVIASQRGASVLLKIYVEDGIRLTPFIQEGKLWLRATQP